MIYIYIIWYIICYNIYNMIYIYILHIIYIYIYITYNIYIYVTYIYITYIYIHIHVYVLYMPWSSYMMPLGALVLPQPRFCSGPRLPAWRKKACLLVESLFLVWRSLVDVYSRILVYIFVFFGLQKSYLMKLNIASAGWEVFQNIFDQYSKPFLAKPPWLDPLLRLGKNDNSRAQFRLVLGLCKVLTQTRQQQALRVARVALGSRRKSGGWSPTLKRGAPNAQNRSSKKWWFHDDMMEY